MLFFTEQISTGKRIEMVNIDNIVLKTIQKSDIQDGLCIVYTPHTTSAITINENADPAVVHDIINFTSKLIPHKADFSHFEGNSDSHIKSSFFGASETIIINDGKPVLGTWQSLFFCEFDGPRTRKIHIKLI